MTEKNGYSIEGLTQNNWFFDRIMTKNPHFYKEPVYSFWGNTAYIDPFNFRWPIPQTVITANTKGHINQTPGYQGSENNIAPLQEIPKD